MNTKKLIVVGGPTASGKTGLAILLAQHFNTEILSADSRQCYRELNIGVAKPYPGELELVPHHFINSHSIEDEVSAGIYERYAMNCLEELFKKYDKVICVGGTGMYLKALCEGIDEMPIVDPKVDEEILASYKANGIEWLQNELRTADPDFIQIGEIQNPARMLRALSFIRSNGQSILAFRTQEKKPRNFDIIRYAIDLDRDELYNRINYRVDDMMHDGLYDEVESLLPYQDLKSLNTVGYTELFDYFNDKSTIEESIDKIKQHTRNYAKRQITWFKHQGDYKWLSAEAIFEEASQL